MRRDVRRGLEWSGWHPGEVDNLRELIEAGEDKNAKDEEGGRPALCGRLR